MTKGETINNYTPYYSGDPEIQFIPDYWVCEYCGEKAYDETQSFGFNHLCERRKEIAVEQTERMVKAIESGKYNKFTAFSKDSKEAIIKKLRDLTGEKP